MYQGLLLRSLRCAYQAKVMNTFDAINIQVANSTGWLVSAFMGRFLQSAYPVQSPRE